MRSWLPGLCAVAATVVVLGNVTPGQSAEPLVFVVAGNPTCTTFLSSIGTVNEFKVDPPISGTFSANGGTVTVTMTGPRTLDWESSGVRINCIVVKGGPVGANIYWYGEDGAIADQGLTTPGGSHNISHYNIASGLEGVPQVGFVDCIFENFQNMCPAGLNAVIYVFNPDDELKQFAFEDENGVRGPSQCVCGNVDLQPCSPNFQDPDACIHEGNPANAQTVILELQATEFFGDPCITIGGERRCRQ